MTPHTHTHAGRDSRASRARASLVECALNERAAGGRVFPTHAHTWGPWECSVGCIRDSNRSICSALLVGKSPSPSPQSKEAAFDSWEKRKDNFLPQLFFIFNLLSQQYMSLAPLSYNFVCFLEFIGMQRLLARGFALQSSFLRGIPSFQLSPKSGSALLR